MRGLEGIAKTQLGGIPPVYLEVTPARGAWIDPLRVASIVTRAGFKVRRNDVLVTVDGTIHLRSDGQPVLRFDDGDREFRLERKGTKNSIQPLWDSILDQSSEREVRYRIGGIWRNALTAKVGESPVLVVAELSKVPAGAE